MRESEGLVKDIKRNKFNMSRAECSLSPPWDFGRSECLVDESRIPLGAPIACQSHKVRR